VDCLTLRKLFNLLLFLKFVCLFTVLRPTQEFSLKYGDVTIAGEGLQIARRSGPFSMEGFCPATPTVTRGISFSGLIQSIVKFRNGNLNSPGY
jgi:hypothetical protein